MNTKEIFEDILYSFKCYMDADKKIRNLTIEQFLETYQNFYYHNRCFIFNTNVLCKPDSYKTFTFILGLYKTRPVNGESRVIKYHKETILYLFPFLELKTDEYGHYYSESYHSSLLLATLPTRTNIINSIIKDLQDD